MATSRWRLRVRLQPRAACTGLIGWHGEAIKVQVQAPPVGGAANEALIDLLATFFAVPHRAVRILHGATSRDKVLEIETPDPAGCQARLEATLQARVDKGKHAD